MGRHVKGILFVDYVRTMRRHKAVDWAQHLQPVDVGFLAQRIDPEGWYPMETFERLGNAILMEVPEIDLEAVRLWGRVSVNVLVDTYPDLLVPNEPVETLMRCRVMRSSFFDFEAVAVPMLFEGQAQVEVSYHMGARAEEAANYQTLGFFEQILEIAGATKVEAAFVERAWKGDARSLLELKWS
jgi:hypothetical protein